MRTLMKQNTRNSEGRCLVQAEATLCAKLLQVFV